MAGVFCIACVVVGFMPTALPAWMRALLAAAGLALLHQGSQTNIAGFALLALIIVIERARVQATPSTT